MKCDNVLLPNSISCVNSTVLWEEMVIVFSDRLFQFASDHPNWLTHTRTPPHTHTSTLSIKFQALLYPLLFICLESTKRSLRYVLKLSRDTLKRPFCETVLKGTVGFLCVLLLLKLRWGGEVFNRSKHKKCKFNFVIFAFKRRFNCLLAIYVTLSLMQ